MPVRLLEVVNKVFVLIIEKIRVGNGCLILIENFDKAISYLLEEVNDTCKSMIVHLLATILVTAIQLLLGFVWTCFFTAYICDFKALSA